MDEINWLDVLDWDNTNVEHLRSTAASYMAQGQYQIAQTFFEGIKVLDPGNSYDVKALGAIHLQINDPVKALMYLEEALTLDPNDEATLINRIKALLTLGYREEGLRLARSLIVTCKDKVIANDAEALLMAYA